jgi:hypothetical protein
MRFLVRQKRGARNRGLAFLPKTAFDHHDAELEMIFERKYEGTFIQATFHTSRVNVELNDNHVISDFSIYYAAWITFDVN